MPARRLRPLTCMLVAVPVLAVAAGPSRADILYQYNAALGALPTSQGWTLAQDFPNSHPTPTVGGGILHQFPQTFTGNQSWYQNQVPLNFATTSYSYELDLRIISSNYIPDVGGNAQRSGYYMTVADQEGRYFGVGIASNGITINTANNNPSNNGVPFTPFNAADGFHLYRLVIDQGVGSLFIDNTLFASTPLGPPAGLDPVVFNRVTFGDASGVGVSESELRSVRFGTLIDTAAVPEPASVAVLGVGALGLLACGRRRRVAG